MNSISLCGVTEIRTRDALLTHTRFPGVPLQPLEHHSIKTVAKILYFFFVTDIGSEYF